MLHDNHVVLISSPRPFSKKSCLVPLITCFCYTVLPIMISIFHSTILLANLSSYTENGVMFTNIRKIWKFFFYSSGSDVDIKELMEKLLYREQSFGKRYECFKWAIRGYGDNFLWPWQGSTNCVHGYEPPRKVCTKRFLRARKSIKTPLSSTPMLFKVASYFCVWKQIIFSTIRSDTHNLFQLRSCCQM